MPFEDRVRDARPEDMLITFGFRELCSRGRKVLVTATTEVMFTLNVELKFSLRFCRSWLFRWEAMPALFTSTGFTINGVWPCGLRKWTNRQDAHISSRCTVLQILL